MERRVRSGTVEARVAQRARAVLLAGDAVSNRAIGDKIGLHYNQVAVWRRRFAEFGVAGLDGVEAFLDEHSGVFLHNTPTHASWLNQVELFFSIMQRRLIRYGEFTSVDDLADRIIEFIVAYNQRAKPFRWTYDGRPLRIA